MNRKSTKLLYSKENRKSFLKNLKKYLSSEDAKDIYTFISIIGLHESSTLQKIIRKIHNEKQTEISQWMDKGVDIHGGLHHRLYHGHDFLANIGPFIKKFGFSRIPEFIWELTKDASTSKGLPLPNVQYMAQAGINKNILNKFGTLNIGSAGAGFIALYDSHRYRKKYQKGFSKKDLAKGFIRIGKIPYGVWKGNPLLIISGVIDSTTLARWFFITGKQIKMEQISINQEYTECLSQCKKMKNEISNLKSEWKNDIEEQKIIDKMFKEALADDENNNKPILKIIKGGK